MPRYNPHKAYRDMGMSEYYDYVVGVDSEIIREVQAFCADIAEAGMDEWTTADGEKIAAMINRSPKPMALFRFMDERTGTTSVGYRTRDGREWFHILRQMRNQPGSGLLENIGA